VVTAIVFDLDGTLVDTLDDLTDANNYALEQLGLPTHTPEEYRMFIGSGSRELCRKALPPNHVDLTDTLLEMILDRYKDHCLDKTVPYRGIRELLAELNRRNIRLAVLSNKPDSLTRHIAVEIFGTECFEIIRGHLDGTPTKPDPTSVLAILEEMKLSPNDVLYVGDSGTDMATAAAAQLASVGVTWGFRNRQELEDTGAGNIIDRAAELLDLL
jgi:phosphoglycolate phosphatase